MKKAFWFAGIVLGAAAISMSVAVAASTELLCGHGEKIAKGDSVACYSDDGCRLAASLGGDPVRDYDQTSAPFALARGKITGIVTSSKELMQHIKKAGGSCRKPS